MEVVGARLQLVMLDPLATSTLFILPAEILYSRLVEAQTSLLVVWRVCKGSGPTYLIAAFCGWQLLHRPGTGEQGQAATWKGFQKASELE